MKLSLFIALLALCFAYFTFTSNVVADNNNDVANNNNNNNNEVAEEAVMEERSIVERAIPPNCVTSFTAPLRFQFCPSAIGSATFTLLSNGRLRVQITLNAGLTVDQARLQIATTNPKPGSGTFNNRFTGNEFTTAQAVCGTTQRIALAVRVKSSGDDDGTFFAWALAPTTLPCGLSFTSFPNGNTGFFTATFCPCNLPNCCNPQNFQFQCIACTPANGNVKCPPLGTLTHCPATNVPPLAGCYCANVATTNPGGVAVTCLADRGNCTGVTVCNKNSDCTNAGEVCQLNSCCGGLNICVALCEARFGTQANDCLNPNLCR